jgi:hypothetical protein
LSVARKGKKEAVVKYLIEFRDKVNKCNETALFEACKNGKEKNSKIFG